MDSDEGNEGNPSLFMHRRAAQLAVEVEMRRGPKRATTADVIRASQIVGAKDACEAAELHGHPFLAWLLRRFVAELRTKPIIQLAKGGDS